MIRIATRTRQTRTRLANATFVAIMTIAILQISSSSYDDTIKTRTRDFSNSVELRVAKSNTLSSIKSSWCVARKCFFVRLTYDATCLLSQRRRRRRTGRINALDCTSIRRLARGDNGAPPYLRLNFPRSDWTPRQIIGTCPRFSSEKIIFTAPCLVRMRIINFWLVIQRICCRRFRFFVYCSKRKILFILHIVT